jgi:hypothetical protein
MFEKILVAVDNSRHAQAATDYGNFHLDSHERLIDYSLTE